MKKPNLLPAALFLWAAAIATAFGSTEETLQKQFSASPGGTLVVNVDFGQVEVGTNDAQEVSIKVWRKISLKNKAEEEAFLRQHPVQFSASDNSVTVESHSPPARGWTWGRSQRKEAKYTISVPAKFNVRVNTAGGGIAVSGVNGELKAETGGGGLRFTGIHGPIDGTTSGGGIEARDCRGDLKLKTSGGSLEIDKGSGTLDARTSGGHIRMEGFDGPAKVVTSGGAIRIRDGSAPLEASTSGGSIEASLTSVAEPVTLKTSGGHIHVSVSKEAAFTLEAETSGGHVSTEIPVATVGKIKPNRLSGTVNGGGKELSLHTSGGNIEIEKR